MKYDADTLNPSSQKTACMVVGAYENKLSTSAAKLDKASKSYLSKLQRRGDISGKAGTTLLLQSVPNIAADRVLIVGLGKSKDFDASKYRKVLKAAACVLSNIKGNTAINCLVELDVEGKDAHWKSRQAVECQEDANYKFDKLKSKKDKEKDGLKKVTFSLSTKTDLKKSKNAVKEGLALANGMNLTKELANLPANICTPTYLASQAQKLARKFKKVKVSVLNEAAMQRLGMNALLSVSRGSRQPAKLITIEYNGAAKSKKPIALVGKGITFDSGGISIKPSAAMDEMKYDMCGAASVFGTLQAIAELKLPINVVGVIPASENLPGGNASKPGDIVKSMSGQTIEILNTDAEGRLVLCDALTYVKKSNPEFVIDIATLTGAVLVALGVHATGLLSNNDKLASHLISAGETSRDRVWQLPLWDEYQEAINSPFADIQNIGDRYAGTITAACFLSRFAKEYKWAHLDIAGTAWNSGKNKGATARPVPLLTQFILDRC